MEEYDTKVVQVTSDIRFGIQGRRGRSRLTSRVAGIVQAGS
jgi:hypothetical protein